MKCVIADPSPAMRRILQNALRRQGCEEILAVGDIPRATEGCDAGTSLLITSWSADGIDGVDLVEKLRSNPETASIPVLMVTDRNIREDILKARQAGITDLLLKPFGEEQLRVKLESLLRPATQSDAEPAPAVVTPPQPMLDPETESPTEMKKAA